MKSFETKRILNVFITIIKALEVYESYNSRIGTLDFTLIPGYLYYALLPNYDGGISSGLVYTSTSSFILGIFRNEADKPILYVECINSTYGNGSSVLAAFQVSSDFNGSHIKLATITKNTWEECADDIIASVYHYLLVGVSGE